MNINDFIDELIIELAYRLDSGIPDLKNKQHLSVLSEILTEWGMSELETPLILTLLGEDEEKEFKNPDLNKVIPYTNVNGEKAEGKVGNLLRRPEKEDAHIQALAALGGKDSDRYKSAMDDLGAEGQPNRDIDKEREAGKDKGGSTSAEQPEQPQQNVVGTDAFSHAPDVKKSKEDKQKTPEIKKPVKINDLKSRVSKEVRDELDSDIEKEEKLNKEILDKLPALSEMPKDIRDGFKTLVARAHLFSRRANAGFGKNNFGKLDRDTLIANRENLLELYDDAKPELVEKGVRAVRPNKVDEDFVRQSYSTLPPALRQYLEGAGQAGKIVGDQHFLGYETEDGGIASDINDSTIKKDEQGHPVIVRGKIPSKQRGMMVWRIYLEQGGMCAYTGEPLNLEEMDLEHVVGIQNKDKGTPTQEDLLNRENEKNHVLTSTRLNQRKKDMNMNEFMEREVVPLLDKTDEDFEAVESAIEEVSTMQPRTEQTAMRLMGDVIFSVKGGGSISQTEYFNLPEDQRPELNTTDFGSPRIKDATFGENVDEKTLQDEFDNEDTLYGNVRKTLQEQLDGSDRQKASAIQTKIGKRVLNALGLPGNLMAPDRRTNSIGPDSFYRGYVLAIASGDEQERERLEELWQEARQYANSDEVRMGGRQKDAFVQYIRERNGIPDFILNDKRYKRVWSYTDENGVSY
jgi:hypothetical protein